MYSHDDYSRLIGQVGGRPFTLPAPLGLPFFFAAFAATLYAKSVLNLEYAGAVLLALIFVFAYYVMQLAMRWRMRDHQAKCLRAGVEPHYVPTNHRVWAGVYTGAFIVTSWCLIRLDVLVKS